MSSPNDVPTLRILGCRGVPAAHGGFETFAERLSLGLVARGWKVVVYCQQESGEPGPRFTTDAWRGIDRVLVRVGSDSPADTVAFDWHATRHAARHDGVCLVLGYNTGFLIPLLRVAGRRVLTNMDGIEWRRPKWSLPVRAWFYGNEWIAALSSNRLVADHPAIATHLSSRRSPKAIVTIPYGADPVSSAPTGPVEELGLEPGRYLLSVARIEPDNNIGLIVRAFSRRRRHAKLVVLGRTDPESAYHRAVLADASDEVIFPGAIYDGRRVRALRFHARAYMHGHMVGGTNPSLVEALWSGNAVIAHRNRYNAWTAGAEQFFFDDEDSCDRVIDEVLTDDVAVRRASWAARTRAETDFDSERILDAYEIEIARLAGQRLPLTANRRPAPARSAGLGLHDAAE